MKKLLLFLPVVCLFPLALCALLYQLPAVKERVEWRVDVLQARVRFALSPPEKAVFIPEQQAAASPAAAFPTPAPTQAATATLPPENTPVPTGTAAPIAAPTLAPTPPPGSVQLSGARHEYQRWNNCGPATLGMALSYWGWQGDQTWIAAIAKPNKRDNNVMPPEMAGYVEAETGLGVIVRYGGDLDTLRRLVAAGFPVIVEKGFEGETFDGWMGHYELVTGYDDAARRFTAQDSYLGPDLEVPYDGLEANWRAFNYTYLVVHPLEREGEVLAVLGPQADESFNRRSAADKAAAEAQALSGLAPRDLFFAWFNTGTTRLALQDFAGAAAAYDQAFAIYPSIPENERPWRMLWYQDGPYWAYYTTGRYQDVINLASETLEHIGEPVLEESYYWRGMARLALEDLEGAIDDFQTALDAHPGYTPAVDRLKEMGEEPE